MTDIVIARDILGEDLPATRRALEGWLQAHFAPDDAIVTRLDKVAGGSHELIDLDVEVGRGARRDTVGMMIRFDPVGFRKRRRSNLHREVEVQLALRARREVPVAEVFRYEPDADLLGAKFYAMERVSGAAPKDRPAYQLEGWVKELEPATRKRLWRNSVATLAAIHRTPVEAVESLREAAPGTDDFTHHLATQYDNALWACGGEPSEVVQAGWDWLLSHLPGNRPAGIAWGDARYGNMMFKGAEVAAVLDWEDVSLGGPLFDLGRWSLSEELHDIWGLPRLEGFGSRTEMLAVWEAESGLSSADLRWYEVFNACFAAALTARIAKVTQTRADAPKAPDGFTTATMEALITRWIETA